MAPPFSPGLAAGLTMIISMNATVCGDMTMVSDWRFMIFYSDQGGLGKKRRNVVVTSRNNDFKLRTESDVPSP
jgi:hypothetical protein